jgi:hypothetical protein
VPITVDADEEKQVLIATASGDLTFARLLEFIRSVRTGELRTWPLLFDMSGATADITAEQVRSLAVDVGSALRSQGERGAVAIVAGTDVLFGVMRMYQILCEQQGVSVIEVFRTRPEAESALGL